MKNYVKILTLLVVFGACNRNADKVQLEVPKNMQSETSNGQIPSDHPIYLMAFESSKYTWKDLDEYYRNKLLQDEQQMHYFKNAKNLAFSHLVRTFNLVELAPQSTLAYYVQEQANMAFTPNSHEYILCLNKLRGYWSQEKIQKMAAERYKKTKSYYLNNKLWKSRWEKDKQKYDELLNYTLQE